MCPAHCSPQPHPRSISSFSPSVSEGVVSAQSTSGSMMVHVPPGYVTEPPAVIPMSDIVKQLDYAANENLRLRHRLEENNHILDQKLHDIQGFMEDKEKKIKGVLLSLAVQWNLSNTDTLEPIKCVLIREVSSFQGNTYLYEVGTWSSVLNREVSSFQGCPLRGVPL